MASPQSQVEQFKIADLQPETEKQADLTFEARLLKAAREYYALTKASREHRYPLWLLVANFAKGREFFLFHKWFHTTVDIDPKLAEQCMYTPSGLLQQAVEIIAAQYGASNGQVVPMPPDAGDPKMKAVMRGLRDYADFLVWEFYQRDPAERQVEQKLIPQRGVYNEIVWDQEHGQRVTLPQYEPVEKKVCGDCGEEIGGQDGHQRKMASDMSWTGNDSEHSANGSLVQIGRTVDQPEVPSQNMEEVVECPQCASPNLRTVTTGVTNKGNVSRKTGAPVKRVHDPYQVEIYDRNRGIESSPYLFCDDVLFKTELKKLCPHLKGDIKGLASFGNYVDGYIGLHYLRQIQCLIGNSGNLNQVGEEHYDASRGGTWSVGWEGSYLNPLLCWRRRVWLDPEVYADWPMGSDKPVQLPGRNEWIDPKTKARDVYPAGLCYWIVNGDTVIWTENQDKNSIWSFVGYRMSSEGLHGNGVTSLVSLVRGWNAANSYALQALLMAALGILVVDERIPNPRNVPGAVLRIPQSARLMGETIPSLAARLEMGGGAVIAAAQPVKDGFMGRINAMTMAANQSGDAQTRPQGVGAGTATAVRYEAGTVSVLTNPPLELYGAHKAKTIEQAVKLTKQRSIRPPQYGKFGDTVKKSFDLMDVPDDVAFGQAEGSFKMKTPETERDDLFGLVNVLPAVAGNEQLTAKALQVFGLADEVGDETDWEIIADKRLDAMKQLAPQFQAQAEEVAAQAEQLMQQAQLVADSPEGATVAQAVQAQIEQAQAQLPLQLIQAANAAPLPMEASGHTAFIHFWEERRKSDEWEEYPPILREAIQRLWAMSQQGVGQAGAIQTEQKVMAMKPATDAQKQDASEQAQQQAALDSQNSQQDNGEQGEESADNAHVRQLQAGNIQHAQTMDAEGMKQSHAKEMENLKHKHAMELEKVRAKNKPKVTGKK